MMIFFLDPTGTKVYARYGQRNAKSADAVQALDAGWRRGDLRWRPSMQAHVPSLFLGGDDLTAAERAALGLAEKQVAFRLATPVGGRAKAAGFLAGDIVLGVEGQPLEGL